MDKRNSMRSGVISRYEGLYDMQPGWTKLIFHSILHTPPSMNSTRAILPFESGVFGVSPASDIG